MIWEVSVSDPWAFGWTQLLTIIGFAITILIALGGFRSFRRWKKEKIEEKRIEAAVDALIVMHESKLVFDSIRSPMSFQAEWDDMPERPGEPEDRRNRRGSFYAVLKRIERSKEFFERAWRLQIRCAALFGPEAGEALMLLQRARREIEVSAQMLMRDPEPTVRTEDNMRTWEKFEGDVWGGYAEALKRADPIEEKLREFREKIEKICRPIIDEQFGKGERVGRWGKVQDWLGL